MKLLYVIIAWFMSFSALGQDTQALFTDSNLLHNRFCYTDYGTSYILSDYFMNLNMECGDSLAIFNNFRLRFEGEKVYIVNSFNCNERLLYDFSLEPGDSFYFPVPEMDAIVADKYKITLSDGIERRVIEYEFPNGPPSWRDKWIEGIGSDMYGLNYNHGGGYEWCYLICTKRGDELLYDAKKAPEYGIPLSCDELACLNVEADFSFVQDGANLELSNHSIFADRYEWSFGDGNTSQEVNPIHSYAEQGCYDVILRAKTICDTIFSEYLVNISVETDPVWQPMTDNVVFEDISFIDDSSGWAISAMDLFRTTDGGDSWEMMEFPRNPFSNSPSTPYRIEMIDESHGLLQLLNDAFGLLTTQNGGLSWEPASGLETFFEVMETTENGRIYIVDPQMPIFFSEDYGLTWNKLYSAVPRDPVVIHNLHYSNGQLYAAVFDLYNHYPYRGTVLQSNNNGYGWKDLGVGPYSDKAVYDIHFFSEEEGLAILEGGAIIKTEDNGANWKEVFRDDSRTLVAFEFINDDFGFMWGTDGNIWRTIDRGECWLKQFCGNNLGIESISATPGGAFSLLQNGAIYKYDPQSEENCENTISGISALEHNSINVYPNPSQSTVYIKTKGIRVSSFELYDLNGRLMHSGRLDHNSPQVDLTERATGLYVLQLLDENTGNRHQLKVLRQ